MIYAILRRQQLDSARWLVAIFALLSGTWYSFGNIVDQGIRFTHWTLGSKMQQPVFTLLGNSFSVQILLRTLLFLSIVYAVIRYSIANRRRQTQPGAGVPERARTAADPGSGNSARHSRLHA